MDTIASTSMSTDVPAGMATSGSVANQAPLEVNNLIVVHLHNDYCHCTSVKLRPAVWGTVRRDALTWDNRTPKCFQRELCRLRLVNKKFLVAATSWLYSHGNLTFDVSYFCTTAIQRQVEYCKKQINHDALRKVTGIRIDLLLNGFGRRLEALDRPGQPQQLSNTMTGEQIQAAEDARNIFLSELPSLAFPVDSVTSLELRLDEPPSERIDRILYGSTGVFMRNKLHNIKDLYFRGSVAAADSILTNLTTNQNGQLRRLLISCPGEDLDTVAHHHPFRGMGYGNAGGYTSYYQVQPQIARLRELSELFIGGCPKGPLMLHDANKGLTKLFLKDVTTTAKHLIDIATKGFGGASPLVELAMSNVNLDNVFHHGITYPAGNWQQVFEAISKHCPDLRVFHMGSHAYVGLNLETVSQEQMARLESDAKAFNNLIRHVRSKPGAVVACPCHPMPEHASEGSVAEGSLTG